MEKTQKSLTLAMIAGLLLTSGIIYTNHNEKECNQVICGEEPTPCNPCENDKHKEQNPLVGVWLINFLTTVDGAAFVDRGNIFFNGEGTYYCACTADLQQAIPTIAPYGVYETHASGLWKRTGERSYKTKEVRILLNKDITPANTACGCENNYVGTPQAYEVREFKFKLSKDGQSLKGTATLSFFSLNDMTLQTPYTGLPSIDFVIMGQRVNF